MISLMPSMISSLRSLAAAGVGVMVPEAEGEDRCGVRIMGWAWMLYMDVIGRVDCGVPVAEDMRGGRWGVLAFRGGDIMPLTTGVGGSSDRGVGGREPASLVAVLKVSGSRSSSSSSLIRAKTLRMMLPIASSLGAASTRTLPTSCTR